MPNLYISAYAQLVATLCIHYWPFVRNIVPSSSIPVSYALPSVKPSMSTPDCVSFSTLCLFLPVWWLSYRA